MPLRDATAYSHPAAADPVLKQPVKQVGRPDPVTWTERDYPSSTNFEAMDLHIAGQQISTAAALAIYRRVSDAAGGAVIPEGLIGLSEEQLLSCGLSRAKATYLLDLAQRHVGDIGIRRAVQRAWQLNAVPSVEETRRRALPWSPYRTYATAQLWTSLATPPPSMQPAGTVGPRARKEAR
jgi:DNA-3-methyladenine glycosylase II